MTPEQERALERITTFLETLTTELGQLGENDRTRSGETMASPAGAAKRVAKMIIKSEQE